MNIGKFTLTGKVKHVLVAAQFGPHGGHITTSVKKAKFFQGLGVQWENHCGARLLDSRDSTALRHGFIKGMEVANLRQWSAISQEELASIGTSMGLQQEIPPGLLGENIIVEGIPKFTELPPGTQLFFRGQDGKIRSTALLVISENGPCGLPGEAIEEHFHGAGLKKAFVEHAKHKRGVIGLVFSSGFVCQGDTVIVEIPDQRLYDPPLAE